MTQSIIPGLLDSRQGLNCSLIYQDSAGVNQSYRVRADYYSHDFELVSEESQARVNRAFYPHRVSPTQFVVQVLLKGTYEYRHFMDWMSQYGFNTALSSDDGTGYARVMAVGLSGRDFVRLGIPVSGYQWGDRVGAMLWTVQITFVLANDVLSPGDSAAAAYSTFSDAATSVTDQDQQYFYPMSAYAAGANDSAYYDNLTKLAIAAQDVNDHEKDLGNSISDAINQFVPWGTTGDSGVPASSSSTWGH